MDKLTWEVTVGQDPKTGDLILPLPQELLDMQGWVEGDEFEWTQNEDGSWTIQKVNS